MNRRRIAMGLVALNVAWLIGGLVVFGISTPIRRCEGGGPDQYCDKVGAPRTREEFERYEIWRTGFLVGWVLLVPAWWWLRRVDESNAST